MSGESHVKRLVAQTVIYGLGIILNKSVNFILLPLYTKYFTPEETGLFTLVQSLSLFLGVIYAFGIETSFMKFFIDARDDKAKAQIYTSSIVLLSTTSIILSALLFFFSSGITDLFGFTGRDESIYLIKILSILLIVDTVYRFPLLLFRARLDSRTYSYINMLTFFVNIISNVIFIVILRTGVEGIFYSYIISVGVTLIAGLIITSNYITRDISFKRIQELLSFGNKFIYIGIFAILIDMSDRFFLKYFYDESVVGIYWANYRLAAIMSLIIAAFKFSWTPYFLNLKEHPENKKIISSVFTYFVFAGLLMFLIFGLFMNGLVKFSLFGFTLLDPSYWEGLTIVPMILLAYFFSGAYSVLNAAPFFTDNTGSILVITFSGFVINILFNFLLIPSFGMNGAAAATMVTYFVMFLIIYYYSQKIYKIDYDLKTIFTIVVIAGVIFAAGYFLVNKTSLNEYLKILIDLVLLVIFLSVIHFGKIIDLKKVSMLWKK